MPVAAITSFANFKELIDSDIPVIIDFWATWCGPCRIISPVFERFSEAAGSDKVGFYKVDTDEQVEVAAECGIRAMPTFILFHKGNKVAEVVGAVPQRLDELVKKAITLVSA